MHADICCVVDATYLPGIGDAGTQAGLTFIGVFFGEGETCLGGDRKVTTHRYVVEKQSRKRNKG